MWMRLRGRHCPLSEILDVDTYEVVSLGRYVYYKDKNRIYIKNWWSFYTIKNENITFFGKEKNYLKDGAGHVLFDGVSININPEKARLIYLETGNSLVELYGDDEKIFFEYGLLDLERLEMLGVQDWEVEKLKSKYDHIAHPERY